MEPPHGSQAGTTTLGTRPLPASFTGGSVAPVGNGLVRAITGTRRAGETNRGCWRWDTRLRVVRVGLLAPNAT